MSETTTSTPETSSPDNEVKGAPKGLQLNKLDKLVGLDRQMRQAHAQEKSTLAYEEYADAHIDWHLRNNGIEDDASDTAKHEEYVYAKELYQNVARTNGIDWITTADGDDVPQRNKVHRELLDRYDPLVTIDAEKIIQPADPNAVINPDTDKTIVIDTKEIKHNREVLLAELAKKKHEAFAAKVNGPAFGQGAKELKEQYLAAEDAYIAAVRAQIEAEVAEKGYQGDAVRDYITQQVNERIKADATAQRDELISAGGHKARFMEKYANLSTGKKIAATVGLGLAGAGAGFLVGTLGAGVATTVAAVGAIRYGRSYATRLSKIYKRDKDVPVYTVEKTDGNAYDNGLDFLRSASVDKMEKAENIKRRAVFGAIGAVALGGAFGVAAHGVADAIADRGGLWNAAENRWNNLRPAFNYPDHSHWPAGYVHHTDGLITDMPRLWHGDVDIDVPAAEPINPHSGGLDTSPNPSTDGGNGGDTSGNRNSEKAVDWKFGADELRIDSGEGWYNELRQMGVKAEDRAELLKTIGPKLEDRGLAYRENGEWRMNMTENGKIPTKDIQMIAEIAREHGIHTNYDKYFDANNVVSQSIDSNDVADFAESRDESKIAHGEGGIEFAREIGIDDVTDRASVWNDTAPGLKDSGLTYYDKSHGDWRLNMTKDGIMPNSAIESMAENAEANDIKTDYTHLFEAESTSDGAGSASAEATTSAAKEANTFVASEMSDNLSQSEMSAYYTVLRDMGMDPVHRAPLLNEAASSLQFMRDSAGNALAERVNGEWRFREVEYLPPEAITKLQQVASRNHWTQAS